MLHSSIPHPLDGPSRISDTMSAEIPKCAAIARVGENNGVSPLLCSSILSSHCLCHVFSLSLSLLLLPSGLRLQHLRGSGVSRGSRAGVESRSSRVWGGNAPGPAGHRTIYPSQTLPRLRLSAREMQEPGRVLPSKHSLMSVWCC